ncbi:MAG: Multidrug resistance protein MdtE [Syntrophus sp. SKADARSKE-3]|nr:Multidrug resistance protein MdtE [Syntrophus sp. SKADARSKE-3]
MNNTGKSSTIITKQHAESNPRYCVLLAVTLVLSFMLTSCQDKISPGKSEIKRPTVSGVAVMKIEPARIEDYYETSGTVRAKATSVVSSRIMGMVTMVNVKEGDRVRAGQILITIDDRDAVQKVNAAEQGLEASRLSSSLADITYGRYKKLHDERAISRQEIDQIETQKKMAASEYERMKASLEEARVYRGFTNIASPCSGWITEKRIETGGMAIPGTPLLTVESDTGFNIEAYVDESLSGKIKKGMAANVVIDAVGLGIKGLITEIVPAVDRMSRTFQIKIAVTDPKLKSGLYSRVLIPIGKKDAILAPKAAVVEKGQLTGIYVLDDKGVMTYRLVRTGKRSDGNVEILSGIAAGERIIAGNVERAVDGGIISEGKSQ